MAILLVLLISVFVFLAMQVLPGDPVRLALGEGADEATIQAYRDKFGLNDPIPVQYWNWIVKILTRWDFGYSIIHSEDVTALMNVRLPNTLAIGIPTLVIGVLFGLFVGIIAAIRRGTWLDQTLTLITNFFLGTPRFLICIFGVYILALKLHLIPLQGYTAPWVDFKDYLYKGIWPIICGSVYITSIVARQTRSNMLEVINQDYVRTARANGLSEKQIILRHTLKNALIPVITVIGIQMRSIVSGAVIIETIFNIPGIGMLLMRGIINRDYFIVQACVFIISLATVFCNLVVDVAYAYIDPRIRKSMR